MTIEAMKQALEALDAYSWEQVDAARAALRQAIEFAEMVKKGTKAWADTPDGWVDDLRGGVEKIVPSDYSNSHQPVAWAKFNQGEITHSEMTDGSGCDFDLKAAGFVPLYTAPVTCQENRQVAPPPQREWVWLSDQDYEEIMKEKTYWYEVAKAVEIKSKEKNT
jgi:hypothetical protein